MAKFTVQKLELSIDEDLLKPTQEFVDAISEAIQGKEDTPFGYSALIEVLDQWGYYVPANITLGAKLYSIEETQVSTFEEAQSNREAFQASFEAAFKGFGGGASLELAEEETSSSSDTSKFKNLSFIQIGGKPGTKDDVEVWRDSLDSALNWDVVRYNRLMPTIALLWKRNHNLAGACVKLMQDHSHLPSTQNLQKVLDIVEYSIDVMNYNAIPV